MGQQYIESIGMYGKQVKKEYASELQCYDDSNELAKICRDMIFNKQWGVWYYEPASKKEADMMCTRFEEKIKELRKKFNVPRYMRDLLMHDTKTSKEWSIDFTFVAFPGLKHSGQRVEGFHQIGVTEDGYPKGEIEEFGTLIISDGKLKIVQW